MNPDNRWVKKAAMIPWETIEAVPEPYRYACKAPAHGTRFAADSEAISLGLRFCVYERLNNNYTEVY